MSNSLTWKDVYVADKEIVILLQHIIYHQRFKNFTLLSLPVQYRSAVTNNALGIIQNRLLFYEPVPTIIIIVFAL